MSIITCLSNVISCRQYFLHDVLLDKYFNQTALTDFNTRIQLYVSNLDGETATLSKLRTPPSDVVPCARKTETRN